MKKYAAARSCRFGRYFNAFVATILLLSFTECANALNIQRVVSPGGIEAWLVRDSATPLIVVDFAFEGGSDQDWPDKPGVAYLATALWDEGAGNLDAKSFHELLEAKAIELGFRATSDQVHGSLRMLRESRDEAFDYLRLALTSPRFDSEAVERIRAEVMSQVRRQTMGPGDIANRRWWETAFPGHPYGRQVSGTLDSVPRISIADLRAYTHRVVAREKLKIAIVGDIDAETVSRLLDRTFGSLPAKPELETIADIGPQGLGRRIVIPLDVPQTVVIFGAPGIARNDPDFMAAYVVNHILGGGSFSSRLYREVREKHGLVYGISSSLVWLNHSAVFLGGTATSSATSETVDLINTEIARMAANGPTGEELSEAKSYLDASFGLALDSSDKIASQLVQIQLDNLGSDYIERRSGRIDAVTLDDAKRVAKRLFSNDLLFTIVGRP